MMDQNSSEAGELFMVLWIFALILFFGLALILGTYFGP